MEWRNRSGRVSEFVLVGFPAPVPLRALLFAIALLAYLLVLIENTLIIMAVRNHPTLHKPMYFFLANMSFLEIWYVTVTIPKMLAGFVGPKQGHGHLISFEGCMTQLYFFLGLACTECILLAVMAYDRYVAICRPLHYPIIVSSQLCVQLAASSWAGVLVSPCSKFFSFLASLTVAPTSSTTFSVMSPHCSTFHALTCPQQSLQTLFWQFLSC